jgi:HEAT repeat protein
MEQLLWTFDDVVRFIDHPDRLVRRWAFERLTKLFPDRAGEAMVAMLDDENDYISRQAAEFLAGAGDVERYGSAMLDRLRQAQGARFGSLAQALARLGDRRALPLVLERFERGGEPLDVREFLCLVSALGILGGDEARGALWTILKSTSEDDRLWAAAAMEALLDAAQPEDVTQLVRLHRSWPPDPYHSRRLVAFASAASASRLAQEMGSAARKGFDAALDRASWWLGRPPMLSAACLDDLAGAFQRDHRGVFDISLREAQRLVAERNDDLAGWRAAWEVGERPVGYRRQALFTLLILEAFAAHPGPDREQRRDESGLGLALVCQLSVDGDDQVRLGAAEDKTEMLLTILAEDRQNVLPGIVEQVAALGPEIVPRLSAMFDPRSFGWGVVRIAETIARIARRHPGSCDAAVPALIEAINGEQGDYLLVACSEALAAIGPAAVEPVAQHLRDDDVSRQIYLTGVLGEIPTESAAQAILDWLADGHPLDEMEIAALSDIGSSSAIEPLYALWKPGDRLLAEHLLVLCELNGVQKPELPRWRRIVEAEEARLAHFLGGAESSLVKEDAGAAEPRETRPASGQSQARPARKSREIGKKERQKRAAQRKASRKKRRKK